MTQSTHILKLETRRIIDLLSWKIILTILTPIIMISVKSHSASTQSHQDNFQRDLGIPNDVPTL